MQASGVEAYVILLMSTLMIHWMLLLVLRSLLIVLCLTLAGCGGEPSSPASPSSPSPTGPAPLVTLSTGTPSAELLVATNAPGKFRYSLGYSIRLPEPLWTRVVTIRRFELWLIGEDGTVHDNRVLGSYEGEKLGGPGFSGPIGKSGGLVAPDDPNITRPPAATYRLSLEYILDNETDTHVVTTESPVTSKVPPLPLMTGLTITSPPVQSPGTRLSKPITFSAAGAGGRLPYEYQWSGGNIVLRDWSTDPRFVWDGLVNGYPQTNETIIVRARGAGGAAPEVVNQLSVFLN